MTTNFDPELYATGNYDLIDSSGGSVQMVLRTVEVNGYDVFKGRSAKPSYGDTYYRPDLTNKSTRLYRTCTWKDDIHDRRTFNRGMCFDDKEDAHNYGRALINKNPNGL